MVACAYADAEQQRAYQAAHFQANKATGAERKRESRRVARQRLIELKQEPCTDCRQRYPYYVMQFDHVGDDKTMNLSRLVRSSGWERIAAEVAKCELVCANCHAARTYARALERGEVDGIL